MKTILNEYNFLKLIRPCNSEYLSKFLQNLPNGGSEAIKSGDGWVAFEHFILKILSGTRGGVIGFPRWVVPP